MAEGGPPIAGASSSSYSNSDVNEQYLTSLMEMGIHRDDARQALKSVNNRSLEDALAVIFGETSFFPGETATSISGARVEQVTQTPYESNVIPTDSDTTDENMMTYKMLFIVNGSLPMSSGKLAAQVAHCAIGLYQQILNRRMMALQFWNISGQKKIVVRGNSAEELLEIEQRASINKSIVTSIIRDAGRTEIAGGSITCLGLFGTNNQLDPITGHLKLMTDCLKCGSGGSANNQQQKSKKNRKDANPPSTTNLDDTSNTQ
ncbi:unnamed protein product [Adineta steineri]|uniref:peptidyl-tRNA hydrolase n=1 Tax=Adineta steineri TaxID=433720 RepID=A0A815GKH2_9BILA|nr:unnamed protein product [Adineta steineri]CAF3800509.1 unnamed protein product [Adineta steineri]